MTFTDEVLSVSDGPFGEGTTYRTQGGPLDTESEWRVTEFDPPRRQVHHGDLGVLQTVLAFELDPADGHTRVHQTVDYELLPQLRSVGWLLERLFVHRWMQRGLNSTIRNLKRIVEGDSITVNRPK